MSKLSVLQLRAEGFEKVRAFFKMRSVLEVDCPCLSQGAPLDLHIDPFPVRVERGQVRYLHTSPEYPMKRLLALTSQDIYQLSHVFRLEEKSPLHNPEFTLLEWYRIGFSFEEMIEETLCLIRLFLGALPSKVSTYRAQFHKVLGIDPQEASLEELLTIAQRKIDLPQSALSWDQDTLLQLLLASQIEPDLGAQELFVLTHFPPSQAALSQTVVHEEKLSALRFEVYFQGIELANGYMELTDPKEQQLRFEKTNEQRDLMGKEALPIDTFFLEALHTGVPSCCGVAVGFDRLLQLQMQADTLQEILPFSWEEI